MLPAQPFLIGFFNKGSITVRMTVSLKICFDVCVCMYVCMLCIICVCIDFTEPTWRNVYIIMTRVLKCAFACDRSWSIWDDPAQLIGCQNPVTDSSRTHPLQKSSWYLLWSVKIFCRLFTLQTKNNKICGLCSFIYKSGLLIGSGGGLFRGLGAT